MIKSILATDRTPQGIRFLPFSEFTMKSSTIEMATLDGTTQEHHSEMKQIAEQAENKIFKYSPTSRSSSSCISSSAAADITTDSFVPKLDTVSSDCTNSSEKISQKMITELDIYPSQRYLSDSGMNYFQFQPGKVTMIFFFGVVPSLHTIDSRKYLFSKS